MFCSKCGNKVSNDAYFCTSCGNNLKVKKQNNEIKINDSNSTKKNLKPIILITLLLIIIFLLIIVCFVVLDSKNNSISSSNSRTIMIYMDGSNLESEAGIATADLNSITPSEVDKNVKVYLYTGGTKKWFNFVSSDENAIYELKDSGFEKVKKYDKKNMGSPDTLSEYLTYVYKNSKTSKYDLVLYNHGGATHGAIYDDYTNDNLSLSDFKKALDDSPFNSRNKLETVLFRTCLNGTIEVANTFKDYSNYMVASEEITNGSAKTSVLNYINDIDSNDSAIDYSKKFIDAYDEQMEKIDPLGFSSNPMYSVIDLNALDDFNKAFDEFIGGVKLKDNYSSIVRLRSDLFQFATSSNISDYDTVDLYDLIVGLENYSSVKSNKVKQAYSKLVLYNWSDMKGANGLSIYFPYNGSSSAQNMLMKVYDDLDYSNNYKKFIKNFKKTYDSGGVTSFSKSLVQNNKTEINKKEFQLELTEEQSKDYADSIYIIFKKEEDGKFTLIYSSNNTKFENNKLKTNIKDNLIKVKTDDNNYFYIPLIERIKDKKSLILFNGVLGNYDKMIMKSAKWYIDYDKKGNPYIVNVVINDDKEGGVGGAVANIDEFNHYSIISSHYNILDENGEYTENWDNNGVVQGYEFTKDEFKMEKASLDDSDYYCVFKIKDIYGKTYYSKLLNLK